MGTKKALTLRIIFAAVILSAVAVLGALVSLRVADDQERTYIKQRKIQIETAAAAIDAGDVVALGGSPADVGTPAYDRLRSQLARIKQSDPHVRFAYLMRPQDGKMVFLVDAEEPSSPEYSPPGQVYEEAVDRDFGVFEGKRKPQAEIEGPVTDRWGKWVSANAYVVDKRGKPVAVVGTDADAERSLASFDQVKRLGIAFDVLLVMLLALVATQWILWRYHKDRRLALQREMEQSAMRLNDELVKADRMKTDFIQLASHELRSPVNAVNIAVQTLDKTLAPRLGEDEQALVSVAKNGTDRLVELVDNLLDVTRMEAGDYILKPSRVELHDLVERAVAIYEPLARQKSIGLTTVLPKGEVGAVLDSHALLRVIENLLANAIKYTDFGGIVISLEPVEEKLRFSVKDSGTGIPEAFREGTFIKFAKLNLPAEQRRQGAGMGLALCKGLVEAQGGKIWFESEEGKGSTFFVELPRYQAEGGEEKGGSGSGESGR